MRKNLAYVVSFAMLCGVAAAQDSAPPPHALIVPTDIKWGEPPPAFEKGMTFAVISGDPSKSGSFVVRAKMPAGFKIAPHWHPTDEHVTVLSGTMAFGMGETFEKAAMKEIPAGGFALLPANMKHYAMATTAATIQVHGNGPFTLTYVNPQDDPRNRILAK